MRGGTRAAGAGWRLAWPRRPRFGPRWPCFYRRVDERAAGEVARGGGSVRGGGPARPSPASSCGFGHGVTSSGCSRPSAASALATRRRRSCSPTGAEHPLGARAVCATLQVLGRPTPPSCTSRCRRCLPASAHVRAAPRPCPGRCYFRIRALRVQQQRLGQQCCPQASLAMITRGHGTQRRFLSWAGPTRA